MKTLNENTLHETGEADPTTDSVQLDKVRRVISKGTTAVLSTVSPVGHPHAALVVYDTVGDVMYVHTLRSSRKGRNLAANERVGVVVSTKRMPFAPPYNVQFQGRATLLDHDDPEVRDLLARGHLKGISAHGTMQEPDGCVVRIEPHGQFHSYGIGVSVRAIMRDPIHGGARSTPVTR